MTIRKDLTDSRVAYFYTKIDGTLGLTLPATNFCERGNYSPENAYTMGISFPDPEMYFARGFITSNPSAFWN
jgi:hypothetical protein